MWKECVCVCFKMELYTRGQIKTISGNLLPIRGRHERAVWTKCFSSVRLVDAKSPPEWEHTCFFLVGGSFVL